MREATSQAVIATNEWKRGWRALLAGFLALGVGWNFLHIASSIFLKPMQAEFGWSRTELAFAPLASFIVALMLPLTGHLLDKYGARKIALIGFSTIALAFFAMGNVPAQKPAYYATVVFLGIAGGLSNSIVVSRAVAPWFDRNFGAATGIMMTGISAAGAIVTPILMFVVATHGWRAGFFTLGSITIVVGIPIILLWFRDPPPLSPGQRQPAPPRDALSDIAKSAAFWKLACGSAIAALPIGGFLNHIVPLLTDRGVTLAGAAGMASIFAIAIGVGRVVNGFLLDRLHAPFVTATTLGLAALGTAILGTGSNSVGIGLAAAISLIGLAQGAEGDYIKFFSIRLFGLANYARVASLMAMVISAGMALGGILFAQIFDHLGTYQPAIYASIGLYALGGLVFATISMKSRFTKVVGITTET